VVYAELEAVLGCPFQRTVVQAVNPPTAVGLDPGAP
jgi:hypothetical protein